MPVILQPMTSQPELRCQSSVRALYRQSARKAGHLFGVRFGGQGLGLSANCLDSVEAIQRFRGFQSERAARQSGCKPELNAHGHLDPAHLVGGNQTQKLKQPLFADRCDLVGHRLGLCAIDRDQRLARVKLTGLAGKRNDLDAVGVLVGGIVADYHGRPCLSHFAA